jgi:S-adenosyl-L-methionine hydrolase (adenosine-forming)
MLILCNKANFLMQIVTLTSDFGTKDYYAAYLKGRILSAGIPVTIVDVTHQIEAYNIVQAAYMLRNAYPAFPKGTIHLLSVNNFYDANPRFLAVSHKGHYFIAADNGVFALLFDVLPEAMYELSIESDFTVHSLNELFANAIGHISQHKPFSEIGRATEKRMERISIQAIIGKNYIRGTVTHIDAFGNVILNIDRSLFERVGQGRAFELYFKRFDPICIVSDKYSDQSEGEILCLFNSSGLLEIAVNSGKAASLFSLSVDDTIQIDFLD